MAQCFVCLSIVCYASIEVGCWLKVYARNFCTFCNFCRLEITFTFAGFWVQTIPSAVPTDSSASFHCYGIIHAISC